ncbi:MAG TPA: sigma-70 family RNA polymerase sigma factor [Actinomycetota bacterium]|nr:sigma-70 family RNA polymerase sigma factor [Actinomycetota bacterium]
MTPPETVADAHHRYRGAVERAAARILRDREDASDIASETFLTMLERGPRDRQAALAWLLTTARNRALNLVRDRQRAARRHLMLVEDFEEPAVSDERLASLVASAMSRLSDRDQAAVLLRFVDDCSPQEIAATLGTSVAASRVVVHRAVKRLRVETVRVLAEHHGVDGACASRLAKAASDGIPAPHAGCSPCSSVADEITALAAHSLLPVGAAPVLHSIAGRAREVIAAVKPRLGGAESHAAEAFAALLLATGLAAPSLPAAQTAAPIAAPPATTRIAPVRTIPSVSADRAQQPMAARQRPAVAAAPTLAEDAEGDVQPLVAPPPGVVVVGKTLRLPDAFDRSADAGTDIRSFAAYTEADDAGEAETLVFLIRMAGTVARSASFEVTWHFEGTACTADAVHDTYGSRTENDRARLAVTCPAEALIRMNPKDNHTTWYVDLVPTTRGDIVEVRVPLRGLPHGLDAILHPGRTLTGLIATTYAATGLVMSDVDRAPDKDGVRYTIGTR